MWFYENNQLNVVLFSRFALCSTQLEPVMGCWPYWSIFHWKVSSWFFSTATFKLQGSKVFFLDFEHQFVFPFHFSNLLWWNSHGCDFCCRRRFTWKDNGECRPASMHTATWLKWGRSETCEYVVNLLWFAKYQAEPCLLSLKYWSFLENSPGGI